MFIQLDGKGSKLKPGETAGQPRNQREFMRKATLEPSHPAPNIPSHESAGRKFKGRKVS